MMEMIVRVVNGQRLWSFTMDEKQLYETLCNCVAWRILKKTGGEVEVVERWTVSIAHKCCEKSDADLAGIKDDFVRAVFQECKRLDIKTLNTKDEKNK